MTDREKVFQGLECCANGNACREKCPYDKLGDSMCDCVPQLARDALALLKEQEPVRPWQVSSMYPWFKCGACHKEIEYEHKFCPFCGKEIRWRD